MWTAPYTLYSGTVTSGGVTGSAVDLLAVSDKHALEYAITVISGADIFFELQGSLDGTNWYAISPNYDVGTVVANSVFGSTTAARYVRVVTWASAGSATVLITGASALT